MKIACQFDATCEKKEENKNHCIEKNQKEICQKVIISVI